MYNNYGYVWMSVDVHGYDYVDVCECVWMCVDVC